MTSFPDGTFVKFTDNKNVVHRGIVLYRIPGKKGQRSTFYKVGAGFRTFRVSFLNLLRNNRD